MIQMSKEQWHWPCELAYKILGVILKHQANGSTKIFHIQKKKRKEEKKNGMPNQCSSSQSYSITN